MSEQRYIHIRNWDRHQHPDTTRNKRYGPPWIKDYTEQMSDSEYLDLSFSDRGLLQAMRLEYALNRGRGLIDSTSSLQRLCGQRVNRASIERLSHAGFIEFSASKHACNPACLDVDKEEDNPLSVPLQDEQAFPDPAPVSPNGVDPQERRLYDLWRELHKKDDKRYDRISPQRLAKIRARRKEFSDLDLALALKASAKDDWAERRRYNDLTVLFRNHEKIDYWLEQATSGNGAGPRSAAERYALEVRP